MDKLFQNKWAIRIMALVFAISLYLYVSVEAGNSAKSESSVIPSPGDSSEVQVLDEVPLDVKIEDDFVVSGVPEDISVSLEGKRRVLTPVVRQQNFKVFIDLRELPEGEHTVDVEYDGIPDDLEVFTEPKTVDVVIEERAAEEFSVDVDIVNTDKLPIGYELGEPEVSPEKISIISSREVIDQIAMVKVFIDATDLRESINNEEVPVTVYDGQGNDLNARIEPENVAVSLSVERPSKKVPLSVETTGELPDGLHLKKVEAEKEIEIFGKQEVLDGVENMTTKKIDLSEIEQSDLYDIDIDFPEGVIADEETVSVNIELEKEKAFDDVEIDARAEDDVKVTFQKPEDGKVTVTAKGSDEVIGKLEKEDIKASIDVKDEEDDKHEADIEIEGPEGMSFKSDPEKVTVDIE